MKKDDFHPKNNYLFYMCKIKTYTSPWIVLVHLTWCLPALRSPGCWEGSGASLSTLLLLLSAWWIKGLKFGQDCSEVSVVCSVHLQGGREGREEKDIHPRRERDTVVYLPGQKTMMWLDTWCEEKYICCSRRSLPRLCFDLSTVLCLLTCS